MFTAYMYLSSWTGNGKRRIPSGVFEKTKSSRNVSPVLKTSPIGRSVSRCPGQIVDGLEFQFQWAPFEARHADHDLAAAAFLLGRQIMVHVIENAVGRKDGRLALPAGAAAAEVGSIDAGGLYRLQNALMLADGNR